MHHGACDLVHSLAARRATLATAESLTGGQLAAAITAIPGASQSYRGGVVSYATDVKTDVLGVDALVVSRHGVVSAECAVQMAERVRELVGSDWALSTTGVAGPDRQEGKAVGTVHVGLAGPEGSRSFLLNLHGDRHAIQHAVVEQALEFLGSVLRGEEPAVG
ncbi:CinA family protein [Nocardioides yefusunii]|uniref:CinA family protein n=1 Tax=Nocardioides yefusunii TaxID=2500546 RepID=A0ABW1QTB7_9ACTN|nr:CinA family protein [Nocardioides yefusunii]